MADLKIADSRAKALLREHGLTGWRVTWNNNKSRNGVCSYRDQTIALSRLTNAARPQHEVEQTILHEVAHALVGPGHAHDRVWLAKARSIGYTGGTTSGTSSAAEVATALAKTSRYVGTCSGCEQRFPKHRIGTRTVLNAPVYGHKGCRGKVTFALNR